jgi:metal-sulfur cluster biosynthetic enzyme
MKLYSIYCFKTMSAETAAAPRPDEQQIRDILRQVIDPEVGRDIVSLGLVYRVELGPDRLLIEMTMTSPACPMGEMIMEDVHAALARALPGTVEPEVRLVWEPPWNPSMMDEATKQHFGWEPE